MKCRLPLVAASSIVLAVLLVTSMSRAADPAIGDCHTSSTEVPVSGATCGGYAGTGQPCEYTGICSSPIPAGLSCPPGTGGTETQIMWDSTAVMSTCQVTSSGSCTYCTDAGTNTGMLCAIGHIYDQGATCNTPTDQEPGNNQLCIVYKYCGGCCKL